MTNSATAHKMDLAFNIVRLYFVMSFTLYINTRKADISFLSTALALRFVFPN